MALPSTARVNRILDAYASAWEKWLQRVERAGLEGTSNRYSPTNWLSDVAATWSDALSVWYFPYQVCNEEDRNLQFEISTTTDEAIDGILVPDPGSDVLTWTPISSGGLGIPVGNIECRLIQQRRTLVVRLFGLQGLTTKLTAGTYSGSVAPSAAPSQRLAQITVKVS